MRCILVFFVVGLHPPKEKIQFQLSPAMGTVKFNGTNLGAPDSKQKAILQIFLPKDPKGHDGLKYRYVHISSSTGW